MPKTRTLALLLLLGWGTMPARADNVMLNDHESAEIRHLTKVARASVAAKRWSEAVAIFQRMVEASPESLYSNKPVEQQPEFYLGVRRYGLRQLSLLPAEGRATYEARYGPVATRMANLAASLGGGDEKALRQIVGRYLFTRAADRAAHRLAAISLERGEADRGAYWLEQLRAKYETKDFQADWLAMLAFCYRSSRQLTQLDRLVADCRDRRERVKIGGVPTPLGDYLSKLQAALADEIGRRRDLDTWPVMGGDATQGRIAPFEVSILRPAWGGRAVTIPQPNSPTVTSFSYARRRELSYQGGQTPSRCMPAVGDGKVFLSNGHVVYAYNLYNGEVVWQATPLVQRLNTPQDRMQSYSVTYHRGAVYAHLEPRNRQPVEKWSRYQIRTPLPRRALVKLDAAQGRQLWDSRRPALGPKALVNRVNICTAPLIRGDVAYTCGVFYEGLFHMYLMAFDTRNGDLLWSRHLGGGQQALNLFGRPYREITYTMPAMHGGRLYITSNLGFISCVDAEEGEVLWVRRYDRVRFPTTQSFLLPSVEVTWFSRPPIVTGGYVVAAPSDSHDLLCIDTESGDVKWRRGRAETNVWNQRDHSLIGVVRGRVFTAGHKLKCYDLETGEKLNEKPLGGQALGIGALTEGKGYIATSGGIVRFDTRTLRMERRALKSSGLLGNVVLAGNVLLAIGEAGNQRYAGEIEMLAYYDWAEMDRNLRAEVARHPDLPFAYNVLAAITYQKQDYSGALELYNKALARAKRSSKRAYRAARRRAQTGLYNTYRARAGDEARANRFDRALRDLARAEKLASGPNQRMRVLELQLDIAERQQDIALLGRLVERVLADFGAQMVRVSHGRTPGGLMALVRLAQAQEKAGMHVAAVTTYQRILVRYADAVHPTTRKLRALFPGETAPRTLEGRQIAARAIDAAMHEHGSKVYRTHEAVAKKRLAIARKSGSINELEALLEHYPNSSVVPEATLLLARRLIDADREQTRHAWEARRRLLDFLAHPDGGPREVEARYLLFKAYDKDKMYPHAKGVLLELKERHGREVVAGPPRVDLASFIAEQLARPEYRSTASAAPLPGIEVPTSRKPRWTVDTTQASDYMHVVKAQGSTPEAYRDRFFYVDLGKIGCRSAADGTRKIWQKVVGRTIIANGVGWVGDTLVAVTRDGTVVGLDPASGKERWSKSLGRPVEQARISNGLVAAVSAIARRGERGGRATLIDGRTGEIAWQKVLPRIDNPSMPLIGRRQLVVWSSDSSNPVLALLELTTGRYVEPVTLSRGAFLDTPPALIEGHDRLAVPLGRRGGRYLMAFVDLGTGKIVKTVTLPGRPRNVTASRQRAFVDYHDGQLEAYDHKGARNWQRSIGSMAHIRVPAGQTLFIGVTGRFVPGGRDVRARAMIIALDQGTGEIQWQSPPQGDFITHVMLSRRYVAALSTDSSAGEEQQVSIYERDSGKLVGQTVVVRKRGERGWTTATLAGGRMIVSIAQKSIKAYGGK